MDPPPATDILWSIERQTTDMSMGATEDETRALVCRLQGVCVFPRIAREKITIEKNSVYEPILKKHGKLPIQN